jgi:hypothetical protein
MPKMYTEPMGYSRLIEQARPVAKFWIHTAARTGPVGPRGHPPCSSSKPCTHRAENLGVSKTDAVHFTVMPLLRTCPVLTSKILGGGFWVIPSPCCYQHRKQYHKVHHCSRAVADHRKDHIDEVFNGSSIPVANCISQANS